MSLGPRRLEFHKPGGRSLLESQDNVSHLFSFLAVTGQPACGAMKARGCVLAGGMTAKKREDSPRGERWDTQGFIPWRLVDPKVDEW